ncbi:receptor-like protein 12 [Cinnamomum micranthum f. kanehirae]|uniref:Receptor-like protein 12 n=1 Tax=Cinnamomum micranthum f. kanehirae TaxID=337451 RepID=A0A3S3QWU2_9MAGN|nr:receptor-like protein 12 [Cinnamomum micranthum f. kanehirae]
MKNCTELKTLDLGENGFSGTIPTWIGERLSFLKFLILRSNKFHGNLPPHLSLLYELQVLDLSQNNLSGTIPESFGNFSAMMVANKTNVFIYNGRSQFIGVESIWVFWKGGQYEYSRTFSLVMNINLSSNDLCGDIPKEITQLFGLQSLNLSRNQLTGTIPEDINDLQRIESLELSWNQLSGVIPHGFSYLTFLSHLNLSHNNFSGRIPSSNQLDTLNDSSIYMENPLLCGSPLLNQCPQDEIFPDSQPLSDGDKEAKDELEIQLFYICMGPGFAVGFWVVYGIFLFKRSWRVAYYNFFDNMGDRLYVAIARQLAKFRKNKGLQDKPLLHLPPSVHPLPCVSIPPSSLRRASPLHAQTSKPSPSRPQPSHPLPGAATSSPSPSHHFHLTIPLHPAQNLSPLPFPPVSSPLSHLENHAQQPPISISIFFLPAQTSPSPFLSNASSSPRLSLHYRPISQPPLRIKHLHRPSRSLLYPHHLRPIPATHSPSPSAIHQKTSASLSSYSSSLSVCHLLFVSVSAASPR